MKSIEDQRREYEKDRELRGLNELAKHRDALLVIDTRHDPQKHAMVDALLYVLDELEKLK